MSRLSLKPGGEPGQWSMGYSLTSEPEGYLMLELPDSDLMDIRSTLIEYLDSKYEMCSGAPAGVKPNGIYDPLGLLVPHWKRWSSRLAWVLVGCIISMVGFWYGWSRVPAIPVSTGGVIDQLCMRPDIECSTSIRYVHPQAGVPHQERETYSADSLSQAHLEEQ